MDNKELKTPKPILVVRINTEIWASSQLNSIQENMQTGMPDYYVFVLSQDDKENFHQDIELQVFYEKDFTEIQYTELREMIEKSLQQTTQHDK
jgi:hypothetical protein